MRSCNSHIGQETVCSPQWQRVQNVLDLQRAQLLLMPQVVGYGVGHKYIDDAATSRLCITILVEKKLNRSVLNQTQTFRIPTVLRGEDGRFVETDVIEIGRPKRFASPGVCIGVEGSVERGTLGIFGKDRDTGNPVALTAMHVLPGVDRYPNATLSDNIPFVASCESTGPSLGPLLRGTRIGIDAAKIEVVGNQPTLNTIPGIGTVRFWRTVDLDGDQGTFVQMRGAATGGVQFGQILNPGVFLPHQKLSSAIMVQMSAIPGDSGAALVDDKKILLGLLFGGDNNIQFFSPISSVFHFLQCDLLI